MSLGLSGLLSLPVLQPILQPILQPLAPQPPAVPPVAPPTPPVEASTDPDPAPTAPVPVGVTPVETPETGGQAPAKVPGPAAPRASVPVPAQQHVALSGPDELPDDIDWARRAAQAAVDHERMMAWIAKVKRADVSEIISLMKPDSRDGVSYESAVSAYGEAASIHRAETRPQDTALKPAG